MTLRYSLLIAVVVSTVAVGVGCAKNPAQADGVVTITETTSTTTTSIIPDVTATGIIQTPPGIGLAGATLFTFATQGLEGGKTPYTFAWDFGDGGAAAGETAQHLFPAPGHFTVKVKVNDSSDKSVELSAPLEVDTVSGRWTVTFAGAMASESLDLCAEWNGSYWSHQPHVERTWCRVRKRGQPEVDVAQSDVCRRATHAVCGNVRRRHRTRPADVEGNSDGLRSVPLRLRGNPLVTAANHCASASGFLTLNPSSSGSSPIAAAETMFMT